MAQHTYNGRSIKICRWSIEWRHFQWPWTTSNPDFKVDAILWRWKSQKRYNIQT